MVTITENGITVEAETIRQAKAAMAKARKAERELQARATELSRMASSRAFEAAGYLAIHSGHCVRTSSECYMRKLDGRRTWQVDTLYGYADVTLYDQFSVVSVVIDNSGRVLAVGIADMSSDKADLWWYAVGVACEQIVRAQLPSSMVDGVAIDHD